MVDHPSLNASEAADLWCSTTPATHDLKAATMPDPVFQRAIASCDARFVLRGSAAFGFVVSDSDLEQSDIDVVVDDARAVQVVASSLRRHGFAVSEGRFYSERFDIPRKRLLLSRAGRLIHKLDLLISPRYFPRSRTTPSPVKGLGVPLADDLLADCLISVSRTAVGMRLAGRSLKGGRILQRIARLQHIAQPARVLSSVARILRLQNRYYRATVTIEAIIAGAHRYSRQREPLEPHENSIDSIVMALATLIAPLDDANPVRFFRARDGLGCFSNFSEHSFVFEGVRWPTAEHCYQAQKFRSRLRRKQIWEQVSPKAAARVGRSNSSDVRLDWNLIRVAKMYAVVKEKVLQNPDVYLTLLATSSREIVECSPRDPFWGVGASGRGKNHLGKLLMSVREDLR